MKEGLKFGLSVGAFLTITTYVAGFIWQYTYLGVITNDIQWMKIVTTDYIHLGVMAIIFVVKPIFWSLVAVYIIFIHSGFLRFLAEKLWLSLSFKSKNKFHWLRDFLRFDVCIVRMISYTFLVFFSLGLYVEIMEVAPEHMASRLSSKGVDRVCDKEENCYEGKVLYIGDKQVYFYDFDDQENVIGGSLVLLSVAESTVFMDWSELGRKLLKEHIYQNE